jgi:ketosteroid isomerase-like protein
MDREIHEFLLKHLQAIQKNDMAAYQETTAGDLTLYEWWVTPQRLDGLPFHEFMMAANAERGTVFGAEENGGKAKSRFDLANLCIQRYGDTAIASYTLLISTALPDGVKVAA